MRTFLALVVALVVALGTAGCGNKYESAIDTEGKVPQATDIPSAKANYDRA